MAISANTVFEVRPSSGSDGNSGGFVAGATGTDYSQQASPHVTFNGSTITASNGAAGATITLSGYTVASTDVGNLLQITGGTSFTTGFYQILSVSTGSNTWTLDRNCTTAAGSAMTGAMGGALKTMGAAAPVVRSVGGVVAFVKAEATISAAATIALGTAASGGAIWYGYATTRGDNGRVTISSTVTSGSAVTGAGQILFANFVVDCNNSSASAGISFTVSAATIRNCLVRNFTAGGVSCNGTSLLHDCEVTSGSGTSPAVSWGLGLVLYCNVHDNTCPGVSVVNGHVIASRVVNNTGASNNGIQCTGATNVVVGNTVSGSGGSGVVIAGNQSGGTYGPAIVLNNILANNGGYGFAATNASPARPEYDGNGYYNNTSGTRNNVDSTAGNFAVGAYTNVRDVTCSADPFTNAAGGSFTLNNTAGGGAALRGAGFPGTIVGSSDVGYLDMGLYQHQDSPAVLVPNIVRNIFLGNDLGPDQW